MERSTKRCGKRDVLGQLRFRRLIRLRKDVAWYPRESTSPEYLYRPGELLVGERDAERVVSGLRKIGARADVARRTKTGLLVLALHSRVDVPETLAELEHVDPSLAGLTTPNHWFMAAPYNHFGPGSEPEVPIAESERPPAREGAGKGARVAVVDSGFLEAGYTHPWLSGVVADADDIENPDTDANGYIDFDAGHGTFVAGCVRRVAPDAAVVVEQILDEHGLVTEDALSEQVFEALASKPHVLNLSLGGYTRDDRAPIGVTSWERVVRDNRDIVVVAAAGNDYTDDRFYPAALPWVVSVGATDPSGESRAWFSNYGEWVDCCARGEGLVDAYAVGNYRTESGDEVREFDGLALWAGTSFATPLVAGAIAAAMEGGSIPAAEALERVLAAAGPVVDGIGPLVDV